MLNDEKLKELINKNLSPDETYSYYFYCVITASAGEIMLLGNLAGLANKYYIVNMTNKKVHIYGLDMMGKPKDYSIILNESILNIKIKNWLFGLGLKITLEMTNGSKIKFKANKHTVGLTNQKNNLMKIEEMYK